MLSRFRLTVGILFFAVGQATSFLIPFVTSSNLSSEWKTVLSSMLFFVTPQIGIFLAIAVLGKPGYEYLKKTIFRWLKKHGPSYHVSHKRYRIGILLFLIPILFGWILPYFSHIIPGYEANKIIFAIAGDCMFIVSFFVLGGEFWDKIRALFIYDSKIKCSTSN